MRRGLLGVYVVLAAACIPDEAEWLVTKTRFRGVKVEVVEPGGYASLLNHPPGRPRATILPLDTVELEWAVAAPPAVEVPAPIWLLCSERCLFSEEAFGFPKLDLGELPECPEPVPLNGAVPCRLGEGRRIRVIVGSAWTVVEEHLYLLLVGSSGGNPAPATCLERLRMQPLAQLEQCVIASWRPSFGPSWATLPFEPAADVVPPEVLAQEVDTNPEVIGFTVTLGSGATERERIVAVGGSVGVRPGERVTVAPIFVEGAAQEYWVMTGGAKDVPWSGTPKARTEVIEFRAWFNAVVDGYPQSPGWSDDPITWTVPPDVVPTTLYLDVHDNRSGVAFAELLFVSDDDS